MHGKDAPDLGHLTPAILSVGKTAFTAIMVVDIFAFGTKMRDAYSLDVFKTVGQTVLVLIGLLICGGWALVAWPH